jgi:hypothetical protein
MRLDRMHRMRHNDSESGPQQARTGAAVGLGEKPVNDA